MTIEITEPATQSVDSVRRSSYAAALELAELLISQSNTLPTSVTVNVYPWAPGAAELRFYFHHDVPGMRQFRDDQMLTETMETRADGSVHCEATRDMDSVLVTAWTLSQPQADAEPVTA